VTEKNGQFNRIDAAMGETPHEAASLALRGGATMFRTWR
jgi:hypothetical protein